jgi:hypothetical protein
LKIVTSLFKLFIYFVVLLMISTKFIDLVYFWSFNSFYTLRINFFINLTYCPHLLKYLSKFHKVQLHFKCIFLINLSNSFMFHCFSHCFVWLKLVTVHNKWSFWADRVFVQESNIYVKVMSIEKNFGKLKVTVSHTLWN